MTDLETINRDLESLARTAASTLGVPFVTVAIEGDADAGNGLAAKAVFTEAGWAQSHGDIDLVGLDNASAVAQNIPFYACVPVRNEAGEAVGRVCCGSGEERGLTDEEIGTLKTTALRVATLLKNSSGLRAFAV
jgi:GAF domain-containing protein